MPLSAYLTSLVAQIGSQAPSLTGRSSSEPVLHLTRILSALTVIVVEVVVVSIVCASLYGLIVLLLRAAPVPARRPQWRGVARLRARNILLALLLAMAAGVLCVNGYMLARGVDVSAYTVDLIRSITAQTWIALATALGKLALAIAGLLIVRGIVHRLLHAAERMVNRWDHLSENNQSLAALFAGLERTIVNIGWILVIVFASILFAFPSTIRNTLLLAVRIYLVVAIGLLVSRSTAVIVETLDGLGHRYARRRDWVQHYEHLRALLPTLRACLEYALWIAVASLVLVQFGSMRNLVAWGPRIIQAIAIFFAGRVIIEFGRLEIVHRMLPREGLAETDRRRRATMVPLVRSGFTYGVYFGTAVLMLGSMGFNPMPFLAGAGLLGLVIGFGAQSLINDVVSGFFILLENIYLVGDIVEVGSARGVVEAIEFRTTKIRDAEGRVHIIRNGDMKPVINYSKDYGVAVVALDVPYHADLQVVFAGLRHASERLRADNDDVLDETRIEGITAFGDSTMTVRTATRVRPGQQETVAKAMRLLINETFERHAGASRKALIGDGYAKQTAAHGV
jgi:moderate conductance mechanosensitive channel